SLKALIESLEAPPPQKGLLPARAASDLLALRALSGREPVREIATSTASIRLLWDVCQLPDFRKISLDQHVQLIEGIYFHLSGTSGRIPDDWLERQIKHLDQIEGDVATLSGRLAQIRTWTYVSHRAEWIGDSGHWQGVTRTIEDRLSDALHQRLTQRFIDRRSSVLIRRLRSDDVMGLSLDESGAVSVDGDVIGKLEGLRFSADPRADLQQRRTFRSAALRGLESEFADRAHRISAAPDNALSLSEHGKIWWEGASLGTLSPSDDPLLPRVLLQADEHLGRDARVLVQQRLDAFVKATLDRRLAPLLYLRAATERKRGDEGALDSAARGIAHQLVENFGSIAASRVPAELDRRSLIRGLSRYGVWIGRRALYLPKLLRPEPAATLALLWSIKSGRKPIASPPPAGATSFLHDSGVTPGFLAAAGFALVGQRAIRFDILERIEDELDNGAKLGLGAAPLLEKIISLLGCSKEAGELVLEELGWASLDVAGHAPGSRVLRFRAKALTGVSRRSPEAPSRNSPFASLAKLRP
ncbi:MAG: helicase, partial [Alphaproteobacteria bacterium]|nr:helicase [Alphaproteobacteria bacterium]